MHKIRRLFWGIRARLKGMSYGKYIDYRLSVQVRELESKNANNSKSE
jgi:hypothetical protein